MEVGDHQKCRTGTRSCFTAFRRLTKVNKTCKTNEMVIRRPFCEPSFVRLQKHILKFDLAITEEITKRRVFRFWVIVLSLHP